MLSSIVYYRIPRQSKPFWRASILDTLGSAALLGAVYPFAGVIIKRMGASDGLLTFLSMAYFLGALLTPGVARAASFVRLGVLLALLRVLSGVVLLASPFALSASLVAVVVVASMVFRVSGSVALTSLLRSHVGTKARPGIMQATRIATFVMTLPIAYFAGKALDSLGPDGYRTVFPVAGVVALLVSLPFVGIQSRTRGTEESGRPGLLEELSVLKRDRRFAVFMLIFFVGTLGEKISMPVTPILFAETLNLSNEQVALAVGVVGPGLAIAGYVIWGQLLRRTDPLPILAVCMLLKAVRPALWAVAPSMEVPLHWICAGEGIFRFLISGLEMGVLLTIMRMSSAREIPMYMGIHFILMAVRGIGGPLLGYVLLRNGVSIANIYWCVAAIVLTGGAMLVVLALVWRTSAPSTASSVAPTDLPMS